MKQYIIYLTTSWYKSQDVFFHPFVNKSSNFTPIRQSVGKKQSELPKQSIWVTIEVEKSLLLKPKSEQPINVFLPTCHHML